ncbi:Gfo/Idh/MocA family protein [Jeotgalibacillus proteolyticus]|uniref:Gfo/Idh/MocA family protein n=1 Tax=Jeotgalibacillus proteolyticus TaxID=2082395 RepID=UPI003CFA015B
MSKPVSFSIIGGSSFRAGYYLKIARELPERFKVAGMVVRDVQKAADLEETWGVTAYPNVNELLKKEQPDFIVISVSASACAEYLLQLADIGIPVLTETPPGSSLSELRLLYEKLNVKKAKVQVAEQYHLHPTNVARLAVINSGMLGEVTEATISISHLYHGASLMRKMLGLHFENAEIKAMRFHSPLTAGPNRSGKPEEERVISAERDLAWVSFGSKLGIYDFTKDQHRSWIRSNHLSLRGTKGELFDDRLVFLQRFDRPMTVDLKRINKGEQENAEGYFLEGITAGEKWVYQNPFAPARLYDDEIAIASCLEKMADYISGGQGFYSFAEAAQDFYLGSMIEKAIATGETFQTERQPWAEEEQ